MRPTPIAVPTTLDEWARAAAIAASADMESQSVSSLRLTQYLMGCPALIAELVPEAHLTSTPSATPPAATSANLRQAISNAINWAELTGALQRQGNGMIRHGDEFVQERLSRPWLASLWPPQAMTVIRQAVQAAEYLMAEVNAGRSVPARPALVDELH